MDQAICSPSRAGVMTGPYPHQQGALTSNIRLPAAVPCLPEMLGDGDYRTGYIGKWHLGDEVFPQHGFAEWAATEDGYTNWYTEGRDHVFMEWNSGADEKAANAKAPAAGQTTYARGENGRAVVSPDGWKLCISDRDTGQLYNLTADPGECTNLFASAEHKAVVARLPRKIHVWQANVGDKLKV